MCWFNSKNANYVVSKNINNNNKNNNPIKLNFSSLSYSQGLYIHPVSFCLI